MPQSFCLCQWGQIHHDLTSGNTSEEILYYTFRDNQKPKKGDMTVVPYHGSNQPQHNSQLAVEHHNDLTSSTVTWLSQCLQCLGPTQNIEWVYLIHDLGSASSPANRTNEKGRLNLEFWVPYTDTQVKSCAQTMKHRHYSNRKRSLLVAHSLINFTDLKF